MVAPGSRNSIGRRLAARSLRRSSRLGIASRVPTSVRQELIAYFGGATNFNDDTVLEKKVRGAIALMLDLPEFQVH